MKLNLSPSKYSRPTTGPKQFVRTMVRGFQTPVGAGHRPRWGVAGLGVSRLVLPSRNPPRGDFL